jgi:hypothetical protein
VLTDRAGFNYAMCMSVWADVVFHLTGETIPALLLCDLLVFVGSILNIRGCYRNWGLKGALLASAITVGYIYGVPALLSPGGFVPASLVSPTSSDKHFYLIHGLQHLGYSAVLALDIWGHASSGNAKQANKSA